jgi:protein-S-isoprenylcysteine O-methyltransferase Ste14
MHILDYVILGLWVAFWIYWLAASRSAKAGQSGWNRSIGVRVVAVLVVLLLVRTRAVHGHVATTDPWLGGIGFAIFVLGLGLAVWARIYLGRNWGTPMSQKEDPELVTTGPYRSVRHPIYTGIILGMIGTAIAVNWFWWVGVGLLGGYFVYSAIMEERSMERTFPDTYPAYKHSTKMLIPYVL